MVQKPPRFLRRFIYSLFRAPLNLFFTLRERGESAACLVECDSKFLFIRNSNYPSLWALPGGRVNKGESPSQAVAREVYEETGLAIRNPELFGEQTSKRGGKVISRTHCFYARVENENVRLDGVEVIEARWFARGSFPEPQSLTAERALVLFEQFSNYPQPRPLNIVE